jgi:hypothetical protein
MRGGADYQRRCTLIVGSLIAVRMSHGVAGHRGRVCRDAIARSLLVTKWEGGGVERAAMVVSQRRDAL